MKNPALAFSKAGRRSRLLEFDLGIPMSICDIELSKQIEVPSWLDLDMGWKQLPPLPKL